MSTNRTPRLRCAVYTRKSTEEGLDQEFNSLDAQHEACAAFIASQVGLGWKLVPDRYDDGGISGGTMERPALQRLLQDIRNRKIDVVVVYKIDRLTRSLMDFSKIVEIFDAAGASFVSVTQQFNTTTSMGRLTLNVLLSFAQFEREVTAERIRDKIAASKAKGMWMGGVVPLGYRAEHRKLVVDEAEADIVRHLFARYLDLKSVRALAEAARAEGLTGRTQRRRDGAVVTTMPFGRGNLYHLLSNPIYVGKIRHKATLHDGEHQAIIAPEVFDQVQALLAAQAPARKSTTNGSQAHLLTGLLVDEAGQKLRSVHANKHGVRYCYYVSRQLVEGRRNGADGWRLPAHQLDSVVERRLTQLINDHAQLSEWIREWVEPETMTGLAAREQEVAAVWQDADRQAKQALLKQLVRSVVLRPGSLTIGLDRRALAQHLFGQSISTDETPESTIITITCPIGMRRRGVETCLALTDGSLPEPVIDPSLVDLMRRAHRYLALITDGSERTLKEVAVMSGTDASEISRLLPLAFLAPKMVEKILNGTQPVELTTLKLSRAELPHLWAEQASMLGC
jgi:DNA invertase Pin-like site-specific DNA recombinase